MLVKKMLSFKALSHKAACLRSTSQKAGLGAMMVACEIAVNRPTVAVASLTVGVSAASIRKGLKVSPFEREMLVGGGLSLGELDNGGFKPFTVDEAETVSPEAIIAAEQVSAESTIEHKKAVLLGPPRMTVNDVLAVYETMSPSEQIALGRAIGVERVWLPRQHRR
jgi:hypothetical protein